jgi:hypothetical protein
MKKNVLLTLVLLAFTFCNEATVDDAVNSKYCWKFTTTTKCTGMSATTVSVEQCNLTEKQAEDIRKNLEAEASSGGITCTITATKKKIN